MKLLLLLAIRGYQRWLSPLKGFSCAHRVVRGGSGCSEFGYRAVRRFGVIGGMQVLNIRLALCAECHAERQAMRPPPLRRRQERGSCALPCDVPCDLPCDAPGALPCDGACQCPSCLDFLSCDWPRSHKDAMPTRAERAEARRRIREQRQDPSA